MAETFLENGVVHTEGDHSLLQAPIVQWETPDEEFEALRKGFSSYMRAVDEPLAAGYYLVHITPEGHLFAGVRQNELQDVQVPRAARLETYIAAVNGHGEIQISKVHRTWQEVEVPQRPRQNRHFATLELINDKWGDFFEEELITPHSEILRSLEKTAPGVWAALQDGRYADVRGYYPIYTDGEQARIAPKAKKHLQDIMQITGIKAILQIKSDGSTEYFEIREDTPAKTN